MTFEGTISCWICYHRTQGAAQHQRRDQPTFIIDGQAVCKEHLDLWREWVLEFSPLQTGSSLGFIEWLPQKVAQVEERRRRERGY